MIFKIFKKKDWNFWIYEKKNQIQWKWMNISEIKYESIVLKDTNKKCIQIHFTCIALILLNSK